MLNNKRVLITGACGTIGSELFAQVLNDYEAAEVIGIDNNESELFFLEQRFDGRSNTRFSLTDIRDAARLDHMLQDIDIVFHTAAYKHVILCERAPIDAVQNNVIGVQNLIRAARLNKVEKVIFTSSDKAVNPTSVMGTSKLMGERLVTAANSNSRDGKPIFASTRFGNVLGSRGSVIPLFRNQIASGGPVTLTECDMTRFIMSISGAVSLVIESAQLACGGEVFITKMPVLAIKDLAEVMIQMLAPGYGYDPADIEIKIIGSKPGEKMYEELMSSEECRRALELKRYFAILPAFTALYRTIKYDYRELVNPTVDKPYNSATETLMTKTQIKDFLLKNNLLEEMQQFSPAKRYWPDPADEHNNKEN